MIQMFTFTVASGLKVGSGQHTTMSMTVPQFYPQYCDKVVPDNGVSDTNCHKKAI